MATPATLDNLLTLMYQDGEVLNGWDAVMNLLESDVNQFFKNQWNKYTNNTGKMSISKVWCEGVNPIRGGGYETTVTQFDIQLGSPLFQFDNASNSVTVTQNILSGTLRQGTKEVDKSFDPSTCNCKVNDPGVNWGKPQTIDTSTKPTLSGDVPLEMVQGVVNATTHSLLLDFAKGAFQINKLTVTGVKNTTIADQMKDWFATNKIQYLLASLNFQDHAGLPALTPTSFQFRVVKTDAGNTIVQMLITTNGTQPASGAYPILEELVPTASGLTCSLMISSKILFNDIFVPSFNKSATKMLAIPKNNGNKWYALIAEGLVSTPDISPPNQPYSTTAGLMTVELLAKEWTLLGATFEPSLIGIQLSYDEIQTLPAKYSVTKYQTYGPFDVPLKAKLKIEEENMLTITGSGADQKLQISNADPLVIAGLTDSSGKLVPEALSLSTEAINSSLQSTLPPLIQASIGAVKFDPVSVFALENLIFPGQAMIKMSDASAPGDLLIVGNIQMSYTEY